MIWVRAKSRSSRLVHRLGGGRINRDAWPHGARECYALDKRALHGGWLGVLHSIHQRGNVFEDLLLTEADLADRHMQQASLVVAELDPPATYLADRTRQIFRLYDRAALRVRHQAARAKLSADAPN